MATYVFNQVDVFTAVPFKGNPLAVIVDGNDLTEQQMAAIASWTNLSETTFLTAPKDPTADYRVRIFTPEHELPFAGHPTLGSCHAWLRAGNSPKGDHVVQECGVGLVRIKRNGHSLAFAAPPLRRSGNVAPDMLARLARGLRVEPAAIKASQWACTSSGLPVLRRPDCRRGGAVGRLKGGPRRQLRGPGIHHGSRGRGPGHRKPQRRARTMVDRVRTCARSLHRQPGYRSGTGRPRLRRA
jgi:hypothetical protein